MGLFNRKPTLVQLQYLIWASVVCISFFSMVSTDGYAHSATYAIVNCCFYLMIVYGNISLLYPQFYQKKHYGLYVTGAFVLLLIAGFFKGYTVAFINTHYFAEAPRIMDTKAHLTFFISGITVFILSFIFRLAIAYFALKQQAEEILLQRSQFELNLLKAQVQPHFLFNTLNNIYYEAYREAPRTALLIEKLSEIMRYFVDESTEDSVPLKTEVQFLENYIALEKIRIRHETKVLFTQQFDENLRLPPMLLMTFVENIFKHGIDKSSLNNTIEISLVQQDNYLVFQTRNTIYNDSSQKKSSGLGIKNLRKRLSIIYGENFELNTRIDGELFDAFLKIPLT